MAQGSEVKIERKIYGKSNVEWKINTRTWGKLGGIKAPTERNRIDGN